VAGGIAAHILELSAKSRRVLCCSSWFWFGGLRSLSERFEKQRNVLPLTATVHHLLCDWSITLSICWLG